MNFDIKKMFGLKPTSRVGLDIGAYAVKIVEISNSGDNAKLVGMGLGKVKERSREAISELIKSLLAESNISANDVAISVSGASVIVRLLSLPNMSETDLKGAIRFEAEKFIPFNMNDCIVDFQILRKIDKENKLEILLAAAKKDYIEERVAIAEGAGLSVNAVCIDSFALTNCFVKNFPSFEKDRAIALVNIGSTFTNLSILKDNTIYFTRDVSIGGGDITALISKALNIDMASAEETKLLPKEKAVDMMSLAKPVLNNLSDEIRLSFSYYENQYGRNVDDIYISGGSRNFTGLEDHFQEVFGTRPKSWDPFQFLDKESSRGVADDVKGSFAVALGLTLR